MSRSARQLIVRSAGRGYGLRAGPWLLPWLPVSVLLATAGLAILSPVAPDTWLALVGGREIVRHGLPSHDDWSTLASGRAWVDQAWLGQLTFYAAYALGGLAGVAVVGRIATSVAGALGVATAAARRSSPLACTLALVVGSVLLVTRNELRPQLLAEPLFAALVWLLAADVRRSSGRVLWAAPLLIVLWANVHGSVVLGSCLILLRVGFGLFRSARSQRSLELRRWAWLGFVAFFAPFASPYSFHLVRYYDSVLGNDSFHKYISEWQPTTLTSAPLPFVSILTVLALIVWKRRAIHIFDACVLLATAVAALLAQRNIVWFALATIALVPPVLDCILPAALTTRRLPGAAALGFAGALIGAITLVHVAVSSDASLSTAYPRSARPIAAAAARDPRSDVLASSWLADWLLFKQPSLAGRLVTDGRFELLTNDEFARYVATLDARRPLAGAFPNARILALNDNPRLAARTRHQLGARVISDQATMIAITLPSSPEAR